MRKAVLAAALTASSLLAACSSAVKAPYDPGVCFVVALPEDGKGEVKFNRLADNQVAVEDCAARLEEMRLRFLRMGGNQRDVVGAYQGKFVFIDARGVSLAQTLDGVKFFALARTGDGRLATPGTIERPPVDPNQKSE